MKWATIRKGFTIVELLIVIAVLGVLAAIVLVSYGAIQDQARYASAISELGQAQKKIGVWSLFEGNINPPNLAAVDPDYFEDTATWIYRTYDRGQEYCLSRTIQDISYFQNSTNLNDYREGSCQDPISVEGVSEPLGYVTQSGQTVNFTQISGTPEITLYGVVNFINADGFYNAIAAMTPVTATNRMQLDTDTTASLTSRYRIDTSATSNVTSAKAGVRTPGVHTGWLQVSNNMTTRSFNYDSPVAFNALALSPGAGFTFTGVQLSGSNASMTTLAAIAYNEAHDEDQRNRVMEWLTSVYGGTITY